MFIVRQPVELGKDIQCLLLLLKTDLSHPQKYLVLHIYRMAKRFAVPKAQFETKLETSFLDMLVSFFLGIEWHKSKTITANFHHMRVKIYSWSNFRIPKRTC